MPFVTFRTAGYVSGDEEWEVWPEEENSANFLDKQGALQQLTALQNLSLQNDDSRLRRFWPPPREAGRGPALTAFFMFSCQWSVPQVRPQPCLRMQCNLLS